MAVNPEPFNAAPMLIGMTALYLLPFLISVVRGHHNKASIFFPESVAWLDIYRLGCIAYMVSVCDKEQFYG